MRTRNYHTVYKALADPSCMRMMELTHEARPLMPRKRGAFIDRKQPMNEPHSKLTA